MESLLTAQDLARLTGLAIQTIYNRHSNGGSLPRCLNLGNRLRFHPRDVEAWLAEAYETPRPSCSPVLSAAPRRRGRPTKAEQIARRRQG